MKITSRILCTVALLAAVLSATANPLDVFGTTRTVVLSAPQLISGGSAGIITNGPIDTHGYLGVVKVDIFSCTNATGGTMTAQLYTSSDTTNLTALANYANATSTTVLVTNMNLGGGTNVSASNVYLLPGTFTTPTASTAGWATSYLAPPPYTNSGAITITARGVYSVGYNVSAQPRYLYIIYSPGGTATNQAVGATLTGLRNSEVK